ncbi:MAG: hypothetical protein GWN18_03495, partial [Thermoplasmata archaeon]|nr:hypothetical protein [Thermoplasmata archaeon]
MNEALFDYGVFSVVRELSHSFNQLEVGDGGRQTVGRLITGGRVDVIGRRVDRLPVPRRVREVAEDILIGSGVLN